MKKQLITILIMLTACGDVGETTMLENSQETRLAWCAKRVSCGTTTESVAECVRVNEESVCSGVDCTSVAIPLQVDTAPLCLEAIDLAACPAIVAPGVCYTSWGLF